MNYYPRYPAHYLIKTIGLTMEQDGAYTRLLDWYYGNERGIPHEERYEISRARNTSERQSTDMVLARFFTREQGVWTNERTQDEIAEAQPKIAASRANGRKGGRPRKNPAGSDGETQQEPGGFSEETQGEPKSKAPQSPIPNTTTDSSRESQSPAAAPALVGTFECHEAPTATPNPAALFARALTSAGVQATSLNPELVAYVQDGGTVEHLLEVAQLPRCQGKGVTYIAKAARGELADRASPITPGVPRATDRNVSAFDATRAAVAGDLTPGGFDEPREPRLVG